MFNNLMTGTNRVLGIKPLFYQIHFAAGGNYLSKEFLSSSENEYGLEGWIVKLASLKVSIKNIDRLKIYGAINHSYSIVKIKWGYTSSDLTQGSKWLKSTAVESDRELLDEDLTALGIPLSENVYIQIDLYTPTYGSSIDQSWSTKVISYVSSTSYLIALDEVKAYSRNKLIGNSVPTDSNRVTWDQLLIKGIHQTCIITIEEKSEPNSSNSYYYDYYRCTLYANLNSMISSNDIYNLYMGNAYVKYGLLVKYQYYSIDSGSEDWETRTMNLINLPSTSIKVANPGNNLLGDVLDSEPYRSVILNNSSDQIDYPLAIGIKLDDRT